MPETGKKTVQPDLVESSAIFDRSGRYRYLLTRRWSHKSAHLAMIMLNPSTASEQVNDPTIRRCIRLGQMWGFGSLSVINLFALRTPHPAILKTAKQPVGKENDAYILATIKSADRIVVAWGNHGNHLERDREILSLLSQHRLWCLGRNDSGQPKHPLYVRADTRLTRYL